MELQCYNVSACYVIYCHARNRGDVGVVVYNEKGGCFLLFDNTTDVIHCRSGSSIFMC